MLGRNTCGASSRSSSSSSSHSGQQAPVPATCMDSLKPGAWEPSWDRHGEHRDPTHGRTLQSSAPPLVNARNQPTPLARGPGCLHAHRAETAAGRRQPPPVGGPRRGPPSPRCSSPLHQRPPKPARGPGNAARPRLSRLGFSAPTSLCPAGLCSTPLVPPAAKAGSPLQQSRTGGRALGSRRGERDPG